MKFYEYEYKRPDLNIYIEKLKNITKVIETKTDIRNICLAIDELFKIQDDFNSMQVIASIRNSIDVTNEFYLKEIEFFDQNLPIYNNELTNCYKALINCEQRLELEKIYSKAWFTKMTLSSKCFNESITEELIKEAKLVTSYQNILAKAKIDFQGKTYSLSQLNVFLNSLDRETRKQAEIQKANYMEKVKDDLATIFDELVKVRTKMAKKLGYDNYIELAYNKLGRSDYDFKMVNNFRKQVLDDIVPLANKIIKKQSKRLGIKDLKFYDLNIFYNDENLKPNKTKDELIESASIMFNNISSETNEFFNFLKEHELFDLEAKPNKALGGYCDYIPTYNSPFIFSNFNGTCDDVEVLTHEAGHAFQAFTTKKHTKVSDLYFPTLEACEIFSMSMEFLAYPSCELFFDNRSDKFKYKHLSNSITFIPYAASVDEFQHYVYENYEATKEERNLKWREIEKKYTPWKDYDHINYYEEGNFWMKQTHIFEVPFYYIDYALAQVCAFQFFLLNEKNKSEAWKKYYSLCELGGTKTFLELLKSIDFLSPFDNNSLSKIVIDLSKELTKLEKKAIVKKPLNPKIDAPLTFLKLGATTFGGGYAMISLMKDEIVEKKHWLTEDELIEMIAIAESTPGPVAINMSTFVGYRINGFLGSLLCTTMTFLPSLLIIFIISLFFNQFLKLQAVAYAFQGIKCVIAFLILKAGIEMAIKMKKNVYSITLLAVVIILMVLFSILSINFSAIYFILIGAFLGVIFYSFLDYKSKAKEGLKK